MKWTRFALILLLLGIISAQSKTENHHKISLLPARPINAGNVNNEPNLWAVAIIDQLVRFRLEPLTEVNTINESDLLPYIPEMAHINAVINEKKYSIAAKELGATHIIIQKFEIFHSKKTLNYYLEILSTRDKQVIINLERDIHLDHFASSIDSCLIFILDKLNIKRTAQSVRFFEIPVLSNNIKNIKRLGEVIQLHRSEGNPGDAEMIREYEKLIAKDPFLLLANYACGLASFKAEKYDKSAHYLKQLLDLAPVHTGLFFTLAQSYRLAGRYDEAFRVVISCEKMRLEKIPLLLEKALNFEGMGNRGSAMSVHLQVLNLDPKNLQSLLFMAKQKNDEAKYKEALQYANKVKTLAPDNGYASLELGRSLFALKKYDKAFDELNSAALLISENPLPQELLGDLYFKKQLYADAATHFKKALDLERNRLDLYLKAAKTLELDNRSPDALILLNGIASRFTNKPQLYKVIGMLEFSNGKLDEAKSNLSNYLKSFQGDGDVWRILGNIHALKLEYQAAIHAFTRAMALVDDKNSCKMPIANIYIQNKEYSAARKLLNEIIAEKSEKGAHRMMGDVLLHEGDSRTALFHYEKERDMHGDDIVVQEKIAMLCFKLGFYVPAKTQFAKLTRLSPSHSSAYYYLAIINLRDGKIDSTEQLLKQAQALGKGDQTIYLLLGDYYDLGGHSEKAIASYSKSLSFSTSNEKIWLKLADALSKSGNDSAAASLYIKLFNTDESRYSSYLAKAGHIYRKAKLDSWAQQTYALFLKKGFSDFNVNVSYASIMYRDQNFSKVISLILPVFNEIKKNEKVLTMLADSYCKTANYSQAIPVLNSLIALNQQNSLVMKLAATAYEKTGDTLVAISFYERYLKSETDDDASAYHLGKLYEEMKMTTKAILIYQNNTKEYPDDLRNHERLGTIFINLKQWKNAQIVLESAVEFPHAMPGLQKMLARTYAAQNEPSKAADLYKRYLARVGNDASAWKELGTIYFNYKNYNGAVNPLTRAAKLLPDDFDCSYMLGASLVENGNYSKAVEPLGRAHTLIANDTRVLELSARCYRHLKETTTLSALLNEWIKIDPKRYDIKIELGSILMDDKNISEAIAVLKDAVKFIPSETRAHLLLANAYELQGKDNLRLIHLNNALKFSPRNWEAHYQLARYNLAYNSLQKAEKYLIESIKFNPNHSQSHFEYGNLLQERGEYPKALEELRAALQSEPNNPRYLGLFAYVLSLSGEEKTAMQNITVALGKGISDPLILYWAGLIYKNTGKLESAKNSINEALTLNPSLPQCYEALGDICMEKLDYRDAAKNFFRSWEKGGYNEKRAFKLITALIYDRKYTEAKDFLETIVGRNPGFSEAMYKLTIVYCELGDIDNARKLFKQFKNDGTPWMLLAQGKINETDNNIVAAKLSYTIAKRLAPENPCVHAGLGHVYFKTGKYDSSIASLSRASAANQYDVHLLTDLGLAFQKSGDLESAFQYFQEVEKKYPRDPQIYHLMVQIKSLQNEHITAAKICEQGLKYNPASTELFFLLGYELELAGQFEPAIDAFQTALKKGKGKPIEAFRHIGNIYYEKLVNDKKAKEFFKRYVKAGGNIQEVSEAIKDLGI